MFVKPRQSSANDELYNYIFTIKSYDNSTKSFSYCDVLTKTVVIYNNNKKISIRNIKNSPFFNRIKKEII